ncbi:cysteamine dioxygenase [Trifolium repens]|nr:cysteamine dioxygenase [Trifolium repens]
MLSRNRFDWERITKMVENSESKTMNPQRNGEKMLERTEITTPFAKRYMTLKKKQSRLRSNSWTRSVCDDCSNGEPPLPSSSHTSFSANLRSNYVQHHQRSQCSFYFSRIGDAISHLMKRDQSRLSLEAHEFVLDTLKPSHLGLDHEAQLVRTYRQSMNGANGPTEVPAIKYIHLHECDKFSKHHIQTGCGSMSVIVYQDHNKPTLITVQI